MKTHERLRVGGRSVSFSDAETIIVRYTAGGTRKRPYAYPSYDGFRTGDATKLFDSDFLAPLLLNAPPTLAGYASMREVRAELAAGLKHVPVKLQLASASDAEVELLRPLYAPLDSGLYDVSGTILSKVLHRKRPAFIPLYDKRVRRCYQDGAGAPLPRQKGRTWCDFMVGFACAIRDDLMSGSDAWERLRDKTPSDPPLTTLRCLDILAWELGEKEAS